VSASCRDVPFADEKNEQSFLLETPLLDARNDTLKEPPRQEMFQRPVLLVGPLGMLPATVRTSC